MPFIVSPNMSLIIPSVGLEPGPQFATDVNNSLTIIDAHTHSLGSGVQITPSGLNINTSLSMQANILTATGAITFQPQVTDAGINSIYEKGVDLYYEDGSGNVIRITQGGSLAGAPGTITGLPSGTASASYISGTFVFQSATSTAANVDGGSFIFRNSTPSSFGLTLQPPNSLGSNFSLTLPVVPSETEVMILDSSGNMGSITYSQLGANISPSGADAIAASMTTTGTNSIIATMGSAGAQQIITNSGATGANTIASHITSIPATNANLIVNSITSINATPADTIAAARTRSVASTVGIGGVAISASSGIFGTTSLSPVQVTNQAVTITTSGRPVKIMIMSDGTGNDSCFQVSDNGGGSTGGKFIITRTGVSWDFPLFNDIGNLQQIPASLSVVDPVGAGTYTYFLFSQSTIAGTTTTTKFVEIVAYEL